MKIKVKIWFKDIIEKEIEVNIENFVSDETASIIAFDYALDELFAQGFGWNWEKIEEGD